MFNICRQTTRVLFCFLLTLAGGCASGINLQVEGTLPVPLASRYPLTVSVNYPDNFREYIYKEDSTSRKNWSIDYRQPRMAMFEQILPSMFQAVAPAAEGTTGVDLVLEPQVIETQVALPQETHSEMYEAWIKYGIKLYEPGGKIITEYQLTGYGKTPTAMFTSKEEGLNEAVNLALRDIGARFVLDFRKAPGMRDWLAGKINCSEYQYLC
jgi:hypothetical protein